MADVADMRAPYRSTTDTFDVEDLVSRDPYKQFKSWFEEACARKEIMEANAMALATASKDGVPSVRMVLMKGYSHEGFKFYTNHDSRKAAELKENPICSIMFYWEQLRRSIRIEGTIERVSDEDSAEYFHSRPRTSQIGSMTSHQSTLIENRDVLKKRYNELLEEYNDENIIIPKPDFWGGYLVKPTSFEFWQGQTNRLHDRLKFRRSKEGEQIDSKITHIGEDGWVFERLSP